MPDRHIDLIISKQLRALCYVLLDDLWCNWTSFLQVLSGTSYSVSNSTKCFWDYLTLKLKTGSREYNSVRSSSNRCLLQPNSDGQGIIILLLVSNIADKLGCNILILGP